MGRSSGRARPRGASLLRLRNLGPRSVEWLLEVGIDSEAALRRIGPAAAYARLKARRPTSVTRTMLWALAGALLHCSWTELPDEIRGRLLRELATQSE